MAEAATDLVRLWHAVHDYLICQANTNDQTGIATLSTSYNQLVSLHNEVFERWIFEEPAPLAGAG